MKAANAIKGAASDIFSKRLGGLALACLALAAAATFGIAWGAFRYVLPLIPEGFGLMAWVWRALEWLSGAGIVVAALLLAPAISMLAGGALFDIAATRIEKALNAPAGRMLRPHEGLMLGWRISLPAIALSLLALPLYLIPGFGLVLFFWLNGYLMGREYAALAAARRMSWRDSRRFRRTAALSTFLIGLVCSFLPFIAPLFGAAAMTRLLVAMEADKGGPARAPSP